MYTNWVNFVLFSTNLPPRLSQLHVLKARCNSNWDPKKAIFTVGEAGGDGKCTYLKHRENVRFYIIFEEIISYQVCIQVAQEMSGPYGNLVLLPCPQERTTAPSLNINHFNIRFILILQYMLRSSIYLSRAVVPSNVFRIFRFAMHVTWPCQPIFLDFTSLPISVEG
jgi:hypothetical protein